MREKISVSESAQKFPLPKKVHIKTPHLPRSVPSLVTSQVVSGVAILSCKCRTKAAFLVGTKIDFPPYLRIEAIELVDRGDSDFNSKPFGAKRFEQISPLLLQLKTAFVGSRLDLSLPWKLSSNEFNFLQTKFLPFFDSCKHFNFGRVSYDQNKAYAFLATLLQHPSIANASTVDIDPINPGYDQYHYDSPGAQFPVETISNWLHKSWAAGELTNKLTGKRSLNLTFVKIGLVNALEIIEHLQKVN